MKILDAIDAARLSRTTGRIGRIEAHYTAEPPITNDFPTDIWKWKFSAEISVVMEGPEKAREALAEQARRIIARAAFGDLEPLLLDALEQVQTETYRAQNDPLVDTLFTMLRMVRGERL